MSGPAIESGLRPVNDGVDAVYVNTIARLRHRHAHVQAQLQRHAIGFDYMLAHDGDRLDPALVATTFGPSDMTAGPQSLVLKNIEIWRDQLARGAARVLVFEDDAVLAPDFHRRLDEALRAADRLAPGWLIYLGGLDCKLPARYFRSAGPLVEHPIATTEAYVCDRAAMVHWLDWVTRHRITLPIDHLFREMDRAGPVRHYWLRHPVVEQGSILGIFETELDRGRRRHSPGYLRLRNTWRKFWRRTVNDWLARLRPGGGPT